MAILSGMKVILIQNAPGLGKIDEIKEVSDGYARNFLFAKNLAVPATPRMLADLEGRKHKKVKENEQELNQQQIMAGKLDGLEVELKANAEKNGALYAAVGPQKVAEALAKLGFKISKDQIIMTPAKAEGEHKAKIKFKHGLEANIVVIVSKI